MSDVRKAATDLADAMADIFAKYSISTRKKIWGALTSDQGDKEVKKLIVNPRRDRNMIARLSFREFLEMAKYNKEQLESLGYEFQIENHLPDGLSILCKKDKKWIGEAYFTQSEEYMRRNTSWYQDSDKLKPGQMWVKNLWVDDNHRRNGIATAMYELAESISNAKIVRTPERTPDSDAVWQQPDRKFGLVQRQ